MLIGTHVLLPVCLALTVENVSLARGRGYVLPPWGLIAVGVAGAFPDVASPHLSLEDRHSSLTHTAAFLAVMIPVCAMAASFFRAPGRVALAVACWLALLLHLIGDAIAGGIAWGYPWRADVIGGYFIPPEHWLWYDVAFVVVTLGLLHWRPFATARGLRVETSA